MATPSVVPNPTPSSQPSELQQAQQALTEARNAPPEESPVEQPVATPEPYQVADLGDGKVQVKFETGEIFTGTQQELLAELAKSKVNANSYIGQLKTQKNELEQRMQQFQQVLNPPAPQGPKIDPAANVILDLIAPALGFENGELLKASMGGMMETSQASQAQMIAGQFQAQNPDFVSHPENADALTNFIESNGLDYNPVHLSLAHNYLKANNGYKHAAAQNATVVQRPTPPPTIPSGFTAPAGSPITEETANNMPLADLGKLVQQLRRAQ